MRMGALVTKSAATGRWSRARCYGLRAMVRRNPIAEGREKPAAKTAIRPAPAVPEQNGLRNDPYANQCGYQ